MAIQRKREVGIAVVVLTAGFSFAARGIAPGLPDLGVNADTHGKRVFPANNAWNEDISRAPVDPESRTIIAEIGASKPLHPDFGTVYNGAPVGIPYSIVTASQPKVTVKFQYEDESDKGPYPVPPNAPIEGGANSDGDRHVLVVDRDAWKLYELWSARHTADGWTAGSGAIFDLNTNAKRPEGWTSADAAGLPIFPGLARYDEAGLRHEIDHALRFTIVRSRRAYIAPATHFASSSNDPTRPPMGMRVRLRADFDVSNFSATNRAILNALKKYGMIVADNGSDWFISGAPDPRWDDDDLHKLTNVKGSDFEVIKMGDLVTK